MKELLAGLGLTKGEIDVYLALNKLGETTTGKLVKESKVSKSKVYDILEKLISKGLVGYIIKDNVKHFSTNDPKMILNYVKKQEEELEQTKIKIQQDLLPQLILARQTATTQRLAEIYEGYQGLKAIREELMATFKPNETLLVLGAPKIANEKWEGWLLDFHKKRIKHKIKMKIIYDADAKKFGEIRKKMSLTEVRYLPKANASLNWIDIFPNAVMFGMVLKTPIAFVVRDKELAKSFKVYFNIMWAQTKK
ncbi:TrmB family transcriptional regulator [Candidatus Woesearchaeota archaeon]|nr:TrmB family transcriptional regulator [Candidatus Woesearchaeota archaeon]